MVQLSTGFVKKQSGTPRMGSSRMDSPSPLALPDGALNRRAPGSVAESVAVREEGIVAALPDVDGDLLHRARPRVREFAGRGIVSEQDVRHALPLRSREPRCHEGVGEG